MIEPKVIVGMLLCWFAPGYMFITAMFPHRSRYALSLLERLLLSVGFSVILVILTGLALSVGHRLHRFNLLPSLWLLTCLLSIFGIIRWHRFHGFRVNRPVINKRDIITALHLLLMLAVIMTPRLYVAFASSPMVPLQPDAWFYLADSLRIINAQGIPREISQWGLSHLTFPPDKIAFQMFSAVFMLITQLEYPLAIAVITLAVTLVSALACWLFARQILHLSLATAVTICLFFDSPFNTNVFMVRYGLTFFKAESFALMLGFLTLWLFYSAVLRDRKRFMACVPFLLTLVFLSHGITAYIVAALVLSVYAAKWVVNLRMDRNDLRTLFFIAGVSLVTSLLYYRAVGTAPLYSEGVMDAKHLVPSGEVDPTVEFRIRLTGLQPEHTLIRKKSQHRFYVPPAELWQELIKESFPSVFLSEHGRVLVTAFFLGLVAIFLLPGIAAERKVHIVAFFGLFVITYLVGLFFSFRYETYSPALVQPSRLFQYARLSVLFWGALIFQCLLDAEKNLIVSMKATWRDRSSVI